MKNNAGETITKKVIPNNTLNTVKWVFIILFVVATILDGSNLGVAASEPAAKVLIFLVAWIHGGQRYGIKNMLIWLGITWLVSNSFEALSIITGCPFGHYHYEIPGPRIADVPLLIMPAYFGMGYIAWRLAQILTGQYAKPLEGAYRFIIPFVSAFIMTAYDVVTDPVASTINAHWVWLDGGIYFGVPLTNFAGWFFVVFCYQQIFALFISRNAGGKHTDSRLVFDKTYWLEPVIVYFVMGLLPVIKAVTHSDHAEIYSSMALVSVFTMIFIAILSYLALRLEWSRDEK